MRIEFNVIDERGEIVPNRPSLTVENPGEFVLVRIDGEIFAAFQTPEAASRAVCFRFNRLHEPIVPQHAA